MIDGWWMLCFLFKQKTAYEMRISDWSSDVCSSDLFSARGRDMAANAGAVDHVLPVVGQAQVDQCLKQGIPDTLLGPATEAHIDRVPLTVSLMHVAPGTADPQHVTHSIEEEPALAPRPRPTHNRNSVVEGKRVAVRVK